MCNLPYYFFFSWPIQGQLLQFVFVCVLVALYVVFDLSSSVSELIFFRCIPKASFVNVAFPGNQFLLQD